jgi:hypothetical protein
MQRWGNPYYNNNVYMEQMLRAMAKQVSAKPCTDQIEQSSKSSNNQHISLALPQEE